MSSHDSADPSAGAPPLPCPVCGGVTEPLLIAHGHAVRRCVGCTHQFSALVPGQAHVATVYGDDYFEGGGAGYPDYLAGAALVREHGRAYARLLAQAGARGRVLDIGCAAGFVLQTLTEAGWQGVGIEPNPRMARHAREQLGLDVRTGTLESAMQPDDAGRTLAAEGFDLIAMIQVIAHFHDLRQALESARSLTRPGGHWLIETWDNASFTARLTGRHWHEYSPPSVLHMFSRASLIRLAADFGMRPVRFGRPAKRIGGAHAKSLLRHTLGQGALGRLAGPLLGLIPDGLRIPYPSEDLFWVLLRRD